MSFTLSSSLRCESVGSAVTSVGGGTVNLLNSVYKAYFKSNARRVSHSLPGQTRQQETWGKAWGRWLTRLGLRSRKRVVRRKRNARHLQSLESELEMLKAQLNKAVSDAQPTPTAPASSSGWPTSTSPPQTTQYVTSPSKLPECPTKKARPPPPPRRGSTAAMPTKV